MITLNVVFFEHCMQSIIKNTEIIVANIRQYFADNDQINIDKYTGLKNSDFI